MPIDLPPPAIVATITEHATETANYEVYGPIDTEVADQRPDDEPHQIARECSQTSDDVIVVCAQINPDQYRIGPIPPRGPTAMDELGEALTLRIGAAEITPFGIRIRF